MPLLERGFYFKGNYLSSHCGLLSLLLMVFTEFHMPEEDIIYLVYFLQKQKGYINLQHPKICFFCPVVSHNEVQKDFQCCQLTVLL